MKIEELRKIDAWDIRNDDLSGASSTIANHWQALLDVAEVAGAKPIIEQWNCDRCNEDEYEEFIEAGLRLKEALKKLEEIK